MKLVYSNEYNGTLYKEEFSTGIRYVDDIQLLTILERELGLYKKFAEKEERLKFFGESLKKYAENSFYAESFKSDQYRVSKELLNLRDDLIMSGWDNSLPNQPKRFIELALVDKHFQSIKNFEGIPDRWKKVLIELTNNNDLQFEFELIIHDEDQYTTPLMREVFRKLNAKYDVKTQSVANSDSNLAVFKDILTQSFNPSFSLDNNELTLTNFKEDDSLLLLKFANKQLLVDTIAAVANEDDYVLLAKDSSDLDYSLVCFNKNASGSLQKNANPKLVQLFKLVISCFSEFNIHTFISFLQLKDSPIPFELKNEILKVIIEIPGFGNEKWNKTIEDFKNQILVKDETLTIKQRNEIVELFLTFDAQSEKEKVEKAKEIVNYLIKWCSRSIFTKQNSYLKEQFNYLQDLLIKLKNLIKDETNLAVIENAFNIVYESSNFTNYLQQENSILCIENPAKFVADCEKTVVITDFYGANSTKDITKLLLNEELEFLQANNCFYNFYDHANLASNLRGLNKINHQLILCFIEGDTIEKHHFHIRMESLFKDLDKSILITIENLNDLNQIEMWNSLKLPLVESKEISIPKPLAYLESDKICNLTKRAVESASSIEKFIQYPFDWILEYKLKMRAYQGIQLGRENQLKGNIAHKVIENIFSSWIEKSVSDYKITSNEFEHEFNKVVQQEGVLFLQPEKRFDLGEFKSKFRKSFFNLVEILIKNELTIESCEYAFGYEEPFYLKEIDANLNGYIDLLLKNNKGTHVVFDLKWTFSDKKYKEKIEKNEEIQLALYTAALKNRTHTITGYFLLNQNKLITTAELVGYNVIQIPSKYTTADVLSKIEKSVRLRWEEIKNGKLEIGDGLSIDVLDYNAVEDTIQLPIKDKKKEPNKYSSFELFKGQLN
jgi:ATP-dependent helicase/nuclease subunit B